MYEWSSFHYAQNAHFQNVLHKWIFALMACVEPKPKDPRYPQL